MDAVLDAPAASLHARPDRLRAEPRTERGVPLRADPRHDAVARRTAARLRLRAALPARRPPPARAEPPTIDGRRRAASLPASTPSPVGAPHERAASRVDGVAKVFGEPLDLAGALAACSALACATPRRARGRRGRASRRRAARCSASSANPAAASPRSAAWSPASCRRATGRCDSAARPATTRRHRRARQLAVQMIFQDPYASLNPRMRVGDIVGEAPRVHGLVPARRARRLCRQRCWPRRARPGDPATLSAPVLRRPAPAHRHRPRARGEARVPRLRRSRRRARRLDPGAGPQPVHGPAPTSSGSPISSSATTSAWSRHISDRVVDHVSRPRGGERAGRGAVRPRRTIPTPRRCSKRAAARRPQASSSRREGRDPLAARPAARLPLPPALPLRDGALPRGGAARLREIAPGRRAACHLNDG